MKEDLATVAYRRLDELISGPEWTRGGRLPAEESLSRMIGVSRPVLRRALAMLRKEGRVVSNRGSGNFVQPRQAEAPVTWPDLNVRNIAELEQCMRFRLVLETGIAEEAARQRKPGDCERMAEANRQLATGLPDGSLFDADFAFHLSLADATGNPFFERALTGIKPQIRLAYEFSRQLRHVPFNEASRRVTEEHERILDAVRAGQPEAAREAMRDHLGAGLERFFGRTG